MTAGVVECAKATILGSRDNDLLGADLRNEKVTRLGNLLGPANGDPVAIPDSLEFTLVVIGIDVPVPVIVLCLSFRLGLGPDRCGFFF